MVFLDEQARKDFTAETCPECPRLDVNKELKGLGHIEDSLLFYDGQVIDPKMTKGMAARLHTVSDGKVHFDYLAETLLQYCGTTVTPKVARMLACQVWARREELKSGPLYLYVQPIRSEWIAIEITAVKYCTHKGRNGLELTLFALTGHPSGHTLGLRVTEGFARYLAYQIAFSRRRKYDDEPSDLIGLRMWGFVMPDETNETLKIVKWDINPSMKKHNGDIVRLRCRFNPKTGQDDPECPHNYDRECRDCEEEENRCPASIHRRLQLK